MFHCSACGMCCRKIGGKSLYQSLDRGDGICMYLSGNWCSIYEKRPLLCRVDDAYDVIFKGKISLEMYYAMNYEVCKRLQEGKRMAIHISFVITIYSLRLLQGFPLIVYGRCCRPLFGTWVRSLSILTILIL